MNIKNNSTIILIITIILILVILVIALLVGKQTSNNKSEEQLLNINYEITGNETSLDKYNTTNPVVAMHIENYGSIVMELYPNIAPNTVNNFISLVKSGFYDNNTFHRLMPGFVLQGGDPSGNGTGGPGYNIKGEFSKNGYNNPLKHEEKVISMARNSLSYDSAGSQFFIMLGKAQNLDDNYAAFGKIIDGWDIIKQIEKNENVADPTTGKLQTNLTIKKAIIDLKGKVYEEAQKVTQ